VRGAAAAVPCMYAICLAGAHFWCVPDGRQHHRQAVLLHALPASLPWLLPALALCCSVRHCRHVTLEGGELHVDMETLCRHGDTMHMWNVDNILLLLLLFRPCDVSASSQAGSVCPVTAAPHTAQRIHHVTTALSHEVRKLAHCCGCSGVCTAVVLPGEVAGRRPCVWVCRHAATAA
jgi:hypothetical protein